MAPRPTLRVLFISIRVPSAPAAILAATLEEKTKQKKRKKKEKRKTRGATAAESDAAKVLRETDPKGPGAKDRPSWSTVVA